MHHQVNGTAERRQYAFTKELIDGYWLRQYNFFDATGELAGQFNYDGERQYLQYDDTEIEVEVISKLFKKTRYLLVDSRSKTTVGEYQLLGTGISLFWQDVPSSPNGTITLNDAVYNFRSLSTGIMPSLLQPESWGHYKFRLYAVRGDQFAEYTLKVALPFLKNMGIENYPFTGTVETNFASMKPVLAACYLIEWEFKHRRVGSDGCYWQENIQDQLKKNLPVI